MIPTLNFLGVCNDLLHLAIVIPCCGAILFVIGVAINTFLTHKAVR